MIICMFLKLLVTLTSRCHSLTIAFILSLDIDLLWETNQKIISFAWYHVEGLEQVQLDTQFDMVVVLRF